MSTKYSEKSENSEDDKRIFCCKTCNYKCSRKQHLKQHLLTQSHKNKEINKINNVENSVNKTNYTFNAIEKKNVCICGKAYKERSGLWRHEKKCKIINETNQKNQTNKLDTLYENIDTNTLSDKQLIALLVEQNMKLIQENCDFKNIMLEVIKNGTNNITNTTHTNSHNKTFNLNFFLNEQCKDALNMSEFLNSIRIELSDLEKTGRSGFVEGISNLILKNLMALGQHKRPIHCSDLKRETLYIKDNDKWEKDNDDKVRFKNVIREIANENIKKINDWTKKYPDCRQADSRKNDIYLHIVSNSMCGSTPEETQKNLDNIVRNIAKEVIIEKL